MSLQRRRGKLERDRSQMADANNPEQNTKNENFFKGKNHITNDIVEATRKVAFSIATDGVGEGQSAHGCIFIVGDAQRLCDENENFGTIKTRFLRLNKCLGGESTDQKYNVLDFEGENDESKRCIQLLCKEDGGVVIDGVTGNVWCGGFFVNDLSHGNKKHGGARGSAASSIAVQAGGCFVFKLSQDCCGTKEKPPPRNARIEVYQCSKESIGEKIPSSYKPPSEPLSILPVVPDLFGREKQLKDLHKKYEESAKMVALEGGGGTGKSHIAKTFTQEWVDERPNTRYGIWLSAETEISLRDSYLQAWHCLGIEYDAIKEKEELAIEEIAKHIWNHLTTKIPSTIEWILVFDNVPEVEDKREGPAALKPWFVPVPKYAKDWGGGRILFTTRSTLYGGNTCLGYIKKIKVDVLEEEEAVDMLLHDIVSSDDDGILYEESKEAAIKLVSKDFFDGLPLAIATANAQIIDEGSNVQKYLEDIQAGLPNNVGKAVDKALEKALTHARECGLGDILDIAAFVNPDRIQEDLFGMENTTVINRLCKLNLLRLVSSKDRVYSIHRLHQEAARQDRSPAIALQSIRNGGFSDFDSRVSGTWKFAKRLLPHVEALINNTQKFILQEEIYNQVLYASVLGDSGEVHFVVFSDYEKARDYYQQELDMYWHVYGPDAKNTNLAITLQNLGFLCSEQDQYKEAHDYYQQALDMERHVYGPDAKNTNLADTLIHIGEWYAQQGQYDKARDYFQQALNMYWHVYGPDAKNTNLAITLQNHGFLCAKQGQYKEAHDYFQQALDMERHVYGPDAQNTKLANTLKNRGALCAKQDQYKEARDYYQQALDMYWHVYGPDAKNSKLASTLQNHGFLCATQGQYKEARDYYQQALDMYWHVYGPDAKNSKLAITLQNHGFLCATQGQYKEARDYYQQALDMYEAFLGDDASLHPSYITIQKYMKANKSNLLWHEISSKGKRFFDFFGHLGSRES